MNKVIILCISKDIFVPIRYLGEKYLCLDIKYAKQFDIDDAIRIIRDLNLKNRGFYDFEFESVEEGIA